MTDKNRYNVVSLFSGCGGFPCQDFSILRGDEARDGIEVEQGKLYMEFARSLA